MQIESVHIHSKMRGKGFGRRMMEYALNWGKGHGAKIIQLTTNKERSDAFIFYEKLYKTLEIPPDNRFL